MPEFTRPFTDYYHSQQHINNRVCHLLGIPLVVFAGLMFLSWFQIVIFGALHVHFGWVVSALLVAFYFTLNKPAAVIAGLLLVALNFLAGWLASPAPVLWHVGLFLVILLTGFGSMVYGHALAGDNPRLKEYGFAVVTGPVTAIRELMQVIGLKR